MTRAFTFRLQALLEHKVRLEDRCRRQFAVAANACEVERERLDKFFAELKKLVNPQLLRLQSLRAEYLDRAIAAQEAIVRSCKEAEEAARARQRDAATQRLALEKLKDRRRNAYAAAQEAIEERERDDACHR